MKQTFEKSAQELKAFKQERETVFDKIASESVGQLERIGIP